MFYIPAILAVSSLMSFTQYFVTGIPGYVALFPILFINLILIKVYSRLTE